MKKYGGFTAFDSRPSARVLVLVPSYNHGRFLNRRIGTILNQTFKDFHLLVIDDKSTDETAQVLGSISGSNLTVRIREKNSGSPFTAWRDALEFGDFEYVWIAESDDAADVTFLANAIEQLRAHPSAAFYYTHSWVVDEHDEISGHSINYLRRQFPVCEWSRSFFMSGQQYNNTIQIFGNAVPNMSSMLMRADAFRGAFEDGLDKFRLAADWAFVGKLAALGDVIFDSRTANYFRIHARTARKETPLERTCVEYARAISIIGDQPGVDASNLQTSLARCAQMFLYEKGSVTSALRETWRYGLSYNVALAQRYFGMLRRPDVAGALRRYLSVGRKYA